MKLQSPNETFSVIGSERKPKRTNILLHIQIIMSYANPLNSVFHLFSVLTYYYSVIDITRDQSIQDFSLKLGSPRWKNIFH